MTDKHWSELKKIVARENTTLSCGLIVDSPWMPGYCGVNNIDFFVRPEVWFDCYRKIKADFPDVIFLPDWWAEYGMAAEPSGFGCKVEFFENNLPTVFHIIDDIEDGDAIRRLQLPNPKKSGLMPLLLNLQRYMQPRIQELGEEIRIVSARGPLTIASHLVGLTELLVGVKTEDENVHRLLKITTQLCKDWLEAQLDNVKTAEGILVLDDVCGFLDDDDYQEFAHSYMKDIFSSFGETMHLFHNDTPNDFYIPHVEDLGVDIFNFTHKRNIGAVRQMIGDKVVLLGNVPPMSLAQKTADEVYAETSQVISDYVTANGGDFHGLLLSTGGGMPMGATRENTQSLIRAA
ncbi:MAG: hypothetical protein IJE26_02060, partial [Oscillospiraceae bacterium]|nr:hypothetical protein [Oscillospiraceae bacterium]